MVVLDTNIFIYLANGRLAGSIVAKTDIAYASITKVEALGFSSIPANELLLLDAFFDESYSLSLTDTIIERAIKLRQARRMTLGDSIIAATALEQGFVLWTANTQDFSHIEALKLHNPLKT